MKTLLLPALALLIGCPPTTPEFDWGDPIDLPEDELDDPADDDDEPQLGPGGSMGIWYWELPPPSGDGVMAGAGFIANFWEDLAFGTPGTPTNPSFAWDGPDGPDDCAINVYDATDLEVTGGTPGVSEERDAGVITVVSPTWSIDVEPWPTTTQQSQYYYELNPDLDVYFDTGYDITVEGAEFPSFDALGDLLVPDAVHLIEPLPAEQFVVGTGDFVVEWDGGSLDEISIELHHGNQLEFGNVSIHCTAINDGLFAIPGAMTAQLPPGELLNLTIGQPRNVTVTVGDVEVDVGSSASAQANGMLN